MGQRAEREQPKRGGDERPKPERREVPVKAPGGGEERGDRGVPRRDPEEEREIRLPGNEPQRGVVTEGRYAQGEGRPSGQEGDGQRPQRGEDESVDVEREPEPVDTER